MGTADIGGIGRFVLDLAGEQKKSGRLDPDIVFLETPRGEFATAFKDLRLPLHVLGLTGGYDMNPRKLVRAFRLFRNFDVIHLHSYHVALWLLGRLARCRVVFTCHGNFGQGRRRTVTDRVRDRFLKRLLDTLTDVVVCNSRWTLATARKRYGLRRVRTEMIYNGVPLDPPPEEDVAATWRDRLRGRFVVGTTCRFAGFKRLDRLIEGFAAFQSGKDAVLVLVGDGPLRGELEAQAGRLGMADKIVFTGYQTNARAWQRLMDVCVFPSEDEPFGLVSVEALAAGKPAIVFADGGGIVEVIGGIAPDDVVTDTRGLAARLDHYFSSPRDDTGIVQRRRHHAETFSVERMAASYEQAYFAVCGLTARVP